MQPLLKSWSFAALVSYAAAATRKTDLVISNAVIAPDGFSRNAIVVNGIEPGALITANKGDRLEINLKNQLTDESMNKSTSVHWHGIFQKNTNAFDGTAFVTQCPIAPGDSFLYNFQVQNQAGTFWYHSHFNLQYCDGLRGGIVIYDPEDPYRHLYDVDDNSTIITLMDWYHVNAYDVAAADNPAAILVNGMGRYPDGPNTALSVTNVERGKRYRIRLINMACKPHIIVSIDNHNFTIIEADGQAMLPHTIDSLPVFVGQRYSIILEANQPVDNYWIRALPGSYPSNFTNGLNSAILRYSGAPEAEPANRTQPAPNVLNEVDLHARDNAVVPGLPYPGGADVNINLVGTMDNTTLEFFMNGFAYHPPDIPTLMQILSGARGIADLAAQGSVYTLPPNKVIEISFPTEFLPTPHPFHLHGHSFYVVRSAGSTQYNYVNPVQRDTVNSGFLTDNVTIRFETNNSGPWMLHCHIDWHLQRGMAVIFAENPNGTAQSDPVNGDWKKLCPTYNGLSSLDQ
ncbi:laccase [Paxillus involutus ATCC 200175]|nr:laccase [Paxillus involutus ATCC 200175]